MEKLWCIFECALRLFSRCGLGRFHSAPAFARSAFLPGGAVRSCKNRKRCCSIETASSFMNENRPERNAARLDPAARRFTAMQSAIVAGEDHRFYRHGGVELDSLGSAVFQTPWFIQGRPRREHNSMQLAGMAGRKPAIPGHAAVVLQKHRQIRAARAPGRFLVQSRDFRSLSESHHFPAAELPGNLLAAARGLVGKEPQGLMNLNRLSCRRLVPFPERQGLTPSAPGPAPLAAGPAIRFRVAPKRMRSHRNQPFETVCRRPAACLLRT